MMENYIIRIYRRKKEKPRQIVGIVEEVGVKGKKAFTNYDELWEILSTPKDEKPKKKTKTKIQSRDHFA